MQNRPLIHTAMPKRRYRVGRYFATLLGDIESSDEHCYHYILAFVLEGQSDPVVYVCAEVTPPPQQAERRISIAGDYGKESGGRQHCRSLG